MKCFKTLLALSALMTFAIQADDKCGCNKPKPPRPTKKLHHTRAAKVAVAQPAAKAKEAKA